MKYIIKIWETEEMRDEGISDIVEFGIKSISEAVEKAKNIMAYEQYASLEVQTEDETNTLYFCTPNEEKYFYNPKEYNENKTPQFISNAVEEYFKKNDIKDLMEYEADSAYNELISISKLYKELMIKVNINYKNIYTEDIDNGKFNTTITFDDNNKIDIQTNAWSGKGIVEENLQLIQEEYKEYQENNIEME
ncbi:MAG: hypothetical protein RR144_01765 [Clostridia bacterium]